MQTDHVAAIVDQWAAERPDLDASALLVVGRIQRLADAHSAALRPALAAAGLGRGEFDVLAALRRCGEPYLLTPSRLAECMLVTPGAVTKRIDSLIERGLVCREQCPNDGRTRWISLSPAGRRLIDELICGHLATQQALLAALSPAEQRTLGRLLTKLSLAAEA